MRRTGMQKNNKENVIAKIRVRRRRRRRRSHEKRGEREN